MAMISSVKLLLQNYNIPNGAGCKFRILICKLLCSGTNIYKKKIGDYAKDGENRLQLRP